MHELFSNQNIYFYPERLQNYKFDTIEVFPMKFLNSEKPDLEQSCEADESETPDFYTVFVVDPEQGRDTIADCATVELATQIEKIMLYAGHNFIRE